MNRSSTALKLPTIRKRSLMIRPSTLAIVAAGLLGLLAIVVAMRSLQTVTQSGEALVFAERTCLDYEVVPQTPAFDACVRGAAKAFERGEPDVAYMLALSAREKQGQRSR